MKKYFYSLMTVWMMASLFSACTGNHTLFSSGKSAYSIVVDPTAGESEQLAAVELQRWIGEVSGVQIPIIGLDEGKTGKRMVVGYNSVLTSLKPDVEQPDVEDETFTYCNEGGDILLWGGSKRGTLYAAYSFLERELGCRWFTPDDYLAPKQDKWQFTSLFNHEAPGLRMRYNCYFDVRNDLTFAARLRDNNNRLPSRTGEAIPESAVNYWNCHTFGQFIPADVYFDEHPEYFSMVDGKRLKERTQLCLSNPDVIALMKEKVLAEMRRNTEPLVYSLSQNDWWNPCQCPDCQALVEKFGGQQSGPVIWFVNQVAEAVKEEFPDKFLGTFAYTYTRTPPENITPLENVVVRLCSIEACLLHDFDECETNRLFYQDLQKWSSIAPNLYIWDYVVPFTQYCLPFPNFKSLQSHIQVFRDNHALGVMEEADYQSRGNEMEELRTYVLSKLLWNPDCDVDSVITDFTDGYYGKAGSYIRDYLEFEHKVLRREGIHQNCYPSPYSPLYDEETFLPEGRRILAEARKAVADDTVLVARVERAEMPLCYLQLKRHPREGVADGALDLFKRVVEREGFDRLSECSGDQFVQDFYNWLEEALKKEEEQ